MLEIAQSVGESDEDEAVQVALNPAHRNTVGRELPESALRSQVHRFPKLRILLQKNPTLKNRVLLCKQERIPDVILPHRSGEKEKEALHVLKAGADIAPRQRVGMVLFRSGLPAVNSKGFELAMVFSSWVIDGALVAVRSPVDEAF